MNLRSSCVLLCLLLCSLINSAADWSKLDNNTLTQTGAFDLLIKNGSIVDGSGSPAYKADVAIKGDRIVRIGDLSRETATRVIDAQGLVVAPGFIDMLGQSESYLLIDPRAMSKVMQGVTTEVTGEGESIAPINERQIKEQEGFLRRFNLNIDWRTLDEYFKRLEKQGSGVNFATFVGATQVREYVIGYEDRAPTKAELQQMKQLVAQAMRDGAFGLSSSLQYVPARFADTAELVELAKVAAQYGGIYATHQRSEGHTIDASLNEVFEIATKAKIKTEIWHLKTAYKKNWGRMPHVSSVSNRRERAALTLVPTFILTSRAVRRSVRRCRRGRLKAALKRRSAVCAILRFANV